MTARKVPLPLLWLGACLSVHTCVGHGLAADSAPTPPQPPPYPAQPDNAPPGQPPSPVGPQAHDARAIDTLVAPIALYPDPLIAIILPASTVPWDVTAASDYLVQYGDVSRLAVQPWDPSVRALAHYPTLLQWMSANIAWTRALGLAFEASPADVMDSVQRLRAKAVAAGTLTTTDQQQVLSVNGETVILPAQPDSLYIPAYDPAVVYSDEPNTDFGGPFIGYGEPFDAGAWLSYSIDWSNHRVWSGDRSGWREHRGWRPPHFVGSQAPPGAKPWLPPQAGAGSALVRGGPGPESVPVPRLIPCAPNPPPVRNRPPASAASAELVPKTAAPSAAGNTAKVPGAEGQVAVAPGTPAPAPRAFQPQPAPAPHYSQPAPAPAPAHAAAPAPAPAASSGGREPSK
jgi:hypothetical protein